MHLLGGAFVLLNKNKTNEAVDYSMVRSLMILLENTMLERLSKAGSVRIQAG